MTDDRKRNRAKALRAARVVTLGLVLAAPGCYASHGVTASDAGEDPVAIDDAGLADAGHDAAMADAGYCDPAAEDWAECCDMLGWPFERGCMAWGPFVPPSDGEVA